MKEGIGETTAFSMVIFPAEDKNLDDRLTVLTVILSTIEENMSFFLRRNCSGSSRYFPAPPSFVIPRGCLTLFLSDAGVLLAKVIADFAAFIIWLEAASYCSRIVIRVE